MTMDYTLKTPEERKERVLSIIMAADEEALTPKYLEKLTDYILELYQGDDESGIISTNRALTIEKRETSYEGLISKMENGEDGIHNLIANDKNIIFKPKVGITEDDEKMIPPLKNLRDAIKQVETAAAAASGKKAYILKKQLIQMRQDQYVIKNAYKKPIFLNSANTIKNLAKADLSETITLGANQLPKSDCIVNLFNPKHVSSLLCNYALLKEETWDKLDSDMRWLLIDLENVAEKVFRTRPLYRDLVILKIDGVQNIDIQKQLYDKYGIKHSIEYISALWRNKIPKLIAEEATNQWLIYHYTMEEKGEWKKCNRCGKIKLAHNNFFSKNKTAKDGCYSICKCCRNKKNKEMKLSDAETNEILREMP